MTSIGQPVWEKNTLPWPHNSSCCLGLILKRHLHTRVHFRKDLRTTSSEWKSRSTPILVQMTILLHCFHAKSCNTITISCAYMMAVAVQLTPEWTCRVEVGQYLQTTVSKATQDSQANLATGIDIGVEAAFPVICSQCPDRWRACRILCSNR